MSLKVHLDGPRLMLDVNAIDGRIVGIAPAGFHAPPGAVSILGLIAKPNCTGFEGDRLRIDFFALVLIETFMRDQHPRMSVKTIRRRMQRFVGGEFLGDMLRLRDGGERMEMALPWQGECEWLAKECVRSVRVGAQMSALNRVVATKRTIP